MRREVWTAEDFPAVHLGHRELPIRPDYVGSMERTPTTEVGEALLGFWAWLKRRGCTASTRTSCEGHLKAFVAFVGDRSMDDLKLRDYEFFLIQNTAQFEANHGREPSLRTQKNVIVALKSFGNYLERHDYATKNMAARLDIPRIPKKKNDWLRPDEDATR